MRELDGFQIEQRELLALSAIATDLYLRHLRKPRGIFTQQRDVLHERCVARLRELGGDLAGLIALCGAQIEHGRKRNRRGNPRMRFGNQIIHVF